MSTMTLIKTISVGAGGAASIDFTSIPATYTDLLIKISLRDNNTSASYGDGVIMSFNNDTTNANYSWRTVKGFTSSTQSQSGTDRSFALSADDSANQTANVFSNGEIYLPSYLSANKKSVASDMVVTNSGVTYWQMVLLAGLWSGTSAINRITLTPAIGTLFNQYSLATLYGIKSS